MNGKGKIIASALVGLAIAFSVIAGSNVLSTTFPSIFGPSTISQGGQELRIGTLVLTAKDAPPQQRELLNLYIQIGDIILHRAPNEQENSTTSGAATVSSAETNATTTTQVTSEEEASGSRIACQPIPEPKPFDVIALRTSGLEAYLGQCQVPEGSYVMIEFDIANASAVFQGDNGTEVSLRIPSESLKVPVHFTIEAGMPTGVTLDFQADQFQVNVNDVLRPVVVGYVRQGPTEEETTTTTAAPPSTT